MSGKAEVTFSAADARSVAAFFASLSSFLAMVKSSCAFSVSDSCSINLDMMLVFSLNMSRMRPLNNFRSFSISPTRLSKCDFADLVDCTSCNRCSRSSDNVVACSFRAAFAASISTTFSVNLETSFATKLFCSTTFAVSSCADAALASQASRSDLRVFVLASATTASASRSWIVDWAESKSPCNSCFSASACTTFVVNLETSPCTIARCFVMLTLSSCNRSTCCSKSSFSVAILATAASLFSISAMTPFKESACPRSSSFSASTATTFCVKCCTSRCISLRWSRNVSISFSFSRDSANCSFRSSFSNSTFSMVFSSSLFSSFAATTSPCSSAFSSAVAMTCRVSLCTSAAIMARCSISSTFSPRTLSSSFSSSCFSDFNLFASSRICAFSCSATWACPWKSTTWSSVEASCSCRSAFSAFTVMTRSVRFLISFWISARCSSSVDVLSSSSTVLSSSSSARSSAASAFASAASICFAWSSISLDIASCSSFNAAFSCADSTSFSVSRWISPWTKCRCSRMVSRSFSASSSFACNSFDISSNFDWSWSFPCFILFCSIATCVISSSSATSP
mmetsp:Transcript_40097/g.121230  ORF Transcript_40097/g.121230 Transcript_40097/m.121230 type:complete len:569 (+) Transcript_40097:400-2106(+)